MSRLVEINGEALDAMASAMLRATVKRRLRRSIHSGEGKDARMLAAILAACVGDKAEDAERLLIDEASAMPDRNINERPAVGNGNGNGHRVGVDERYVASAYPMYTDGATGALCAFERGDNLVSVLGTLGHGMSQWWDAPTDEVGEDDAEPSGFDVTVEVRS